MASLHRQCERRGFTLVEVLIACMLMALMGATTLGVIVASGRMSMSTAQHARATAFAEEWMEQLMAAPFDHIVPGRTLPTGFTIPGDNSPRPFTGAGDLGDNPQWSLEITSPDEFHRLISLTVHWSDPVTGRSVERNVRCYRYDEHIIGYPRIPGRPR